MRTAQSTRHRQTDGYERRCWVILRVNGRNLLQPAAAAAVLIEPYGNAILNCALSHDDDDNDYDDDRHTRRRVLPKTSPSGISSIGSSQCWQAGECEHTIARRFAHSRAWHRPHHYYDDDYAAATSYRISYVWLCWTQAHQRPHAHARARAHTHKHTRWF